MRLILLMTCRTRSSGKEPCLCVDMVQREAILGYEEAILGYEDR
jgi:hypothetical protein